MNVTYMEETHPEIDDVLACCKVMDIIAYFDSNSETNQQ